METGFVDDRYSTCAVGRQGVEREWKERSGRAEKGKEREAQEKDEKKLFDVQAEKRGDKRLPRNS